MIHKTAIVSKKAEIADGVKIGPYTIIGDEVKIGAGTCVGPHVVLEGPTTIGKNCKIFQFCSIGAVPQDLKFNNERTEVIIGDDNTFREFVTINRGTSGGDGKTIIGSRCFLMAYSHVAHDCRIGNSVIIANGASLAGHIQIEDHAILGGIVGVHQFVHIGSYAMVGGLSGVSRDVPPYTMAVGQRATLRGLNLTGLKRHGFTEDAIRALKEAYRILFRAGLTTQKALVKIESQKPQAAEVQHLVEFVQNSERGVLRE